MRDLYIIDLHRGKRIDNGEWVYGFYFCMYHDDDREHLHHFIIPLNVSIPKNRPIGEIQVEVDPDTVGQCVGDLPDKNGKNIFNKDICRFREWNNGEMCWVGYVKYEHCQYVILGGTNKECPTDFYIPLSRISSENIEVIGNTHDNPELLLI